MAISYLHLMAIFGTLFFVGTSASDECPPEEEPECNEYTYGPCTLKIEQKTNENSNGVSIEIDVSVISSSCSQCQLEKPSDPAYVEFPGHGYYKYHDTPMMWFAAWEACKNEGAHLTVFNSQEEAEFVGNISSNQYDWAFIGFHDLYEEGKYVTIFDQTLDEAGWNTWPQSDPNGGTQENCGVTFPSGELGDYVCANPRTFFCEISCQNI